MNGKKTPAILLAALLVLSLLTACASSGGTPKASAAPVETDKVMKIGTSQSCSTLDPANGYDYWYTVRYGVGETLMKFGEDMSPSPWLAKEKPQVSEDNLSWTVQLRDDVVFSSGEKLTAEKAKSALERQYAESGPAKGYFTLKEIKAEGQTLTIVTESPVPIMPYLLADPVFVIYDTANLTDVADKGPIGTGPFVFSAFDPTTRNTSVLRNEKYWGGKVKLAGIDFTMLADASTLTMSLQNGEQDAAYSVNVEDISKFESDPNYTVLTSPSGRTTFGFLNQNEGRVFRDEKLRQAVTRIADRVTYCHALFYDQFVPGVTPLTSSLPYGYHELKDINAYDVDGAVKLLDEAGYVDKDGDGWRDMPDGSPLDIVITTYTGRIEMPLLAQAMQNDGKKVGLKFTIDTRDSATAWSLLTAGEYDMLLMSISMASSGDPENGLKSYFRSYSEETPNYNRSGYSNPEVDRLFTELNGTFDLNKRTALIKEIEQHLMDDSCAIYFCYPLMNFVTKKNVTGVTSHTSDYYWVSKDTGFTA